MKIKLFGFGVVACLMAGPSVFADLIKEVAVPNAYTVNINASAVGGYSGSVLAGFYRIQFGNSSGPTLDTFCIDVYDYSPTDGFHTYAKSALKDAPLSKNLNVAMGENAANAIKALWAMYYDDAKDKPLDAAALQVAIWEAMLDTGSGYNLGSGNFKASDNDGVTTRAAQLLGGIAEYSGPLPDLFAWVNQDEVHYYQDYIGVPDGGLTVILLGLAFGGLSIVRRKQ